MPNMFVLLSNMSIENGGYTVAAIAYVEPDSPAIGVSVGVAWNATASQLNNAVIDAAVVSAAAAGYIVGPADKKILMGGAS